MILFTALPTRAQILSCPDIKSTLEAAGDKAAPFKGKKLDGNFDCFRSPGLGPTFTYPAKFHGATFVGVADFEQADFQCGADFSQTTFERQANFRSAKFSVLSSCKAQVRNYEFANFIQAQFDGVATFIDTWFVEPACFWLATFQDIACFSQTRFSTDAFFNEATFIKDAEFPNARFHAALNMSRAEFQSLLRLARVEVNGDVDAADAQFASSVIERAVFKGEVGLARATFAGPVHWEDVKLRGKVDLRQATFAAPVRWSYVDAVDMRLSWGQSFLNEQLREWGTADDIPPPRVFGPCPSLQLAPRAAPRQSLADVMIDLQNVLLKNGQLAESNAIEARILDERAAREGCFGRLKWVLLGLPSRWGTDLRRLAFSTLVIAAVFWVLFFLCDLERLDDEPAAKVEGGLRLRLMEPFVVGGGTFSRRLTESKMGQVTSITMRSFFKVGFGHTYRLSKTARVVAAVSWTVGLFVLAHLAVTLKNTIPVLNALLGHVF